MTKKWLGVLGVAFGMCLAGSFAPAAHAQDMGKISVFAGYSWTTNTIGNSIENFTEEEDFFGNGASGLSGYTVSGVWNLSNNIGLEANFDGHNGSPTGFSCSGPANVDDCEGDSSFSEKTRQDLYIYTFGPKFTVPIGNWSIFGHVLVGGVHAHEGITECFTEVVDPCEGEFHATANGFALKTGGGLDWNHGHWGIRLAEIDFVHIAASTTGAFDGDTESFKFPASANNVEVATGITFNFGK